MIVSRLLVASLLTIGLTTMAHADNANKSTADPARCDKLAAYYDDHGGAVGRRYEPQGQLNRTLGEEACHAGRFTEGVALLEQAIRENGFNPPTD
ncbi:hypothetical protein [Reyranella sp. CPCC 100927]|uniref:hypothetical protein n=1 Tax=Reyranella sp. CPCC 100927 TaxID=2599616 RepID=UPI0011B4BB9D|nr:hypothetical protein [Reyranella sp. CPCC 100927]TWT14092.1 hypothetical protein FQU96_09360 [Reyranella sp. CPCC 100927]